MSYFSCNPDLFGKRVVKYIRCSHDDQVLHGDTLEAQNALLDDFISANHMILVDTFVDEALTARKKYTKRKEFVRLLDGVKAHDFEMIIFTKLDRWFRNIGDYHKIQEILEANGVQWKAITEQYDTTTTNGRLHINIRLSVAQDECDRDSDRIKDVFSYKLRNKSYCSGSLPPGLKLDEEKHVIIDEEKRQMVEDMFNVFESTGSKRRAMTFLQEKYHVSLCYNTIHRCLKNPLYKGEYKGDPDFCPAIISPARFDHLQQLSDCNVRVRRNNRVYIFSGILICSSCGCRMPGNSHYKKMADGSEKVYTSYRCPSHGISNRCDRAARMKEETVETYLLNNLRTVMLDFIVRYDIAATGQAKRNPEEEAAKIQRKIKKLYDLFMEDLIDKEQYRNEYTRFQEELKNIQTAPSKPEYTLTTMQNLLSQPWEEIYTTFTRQEKNAFWKSIIRSIVVQNNGNMDVHFV